MENGGNNNDSDEKLPEDFLRILQDLRAEIEQEERAVAEEKFLIEKYEARTKEHTAEINRTKKYNAELESMLKHLTNMHNTQMKHLESSKDVEELLRHQVKSKEEELYRLKEKHSEMKKECERKHDHYQEIYCERMLVYDSLPMVPEYKRQVARLEELQTVLHDKKRELEASKEELATIAAEQGLIQSSAQTMQSITQNQIKSKSMKSVAELETEVQVLQAKKENILKKQEIERKSVFKAATFKDLKPIAKSSSLENVAQSTFLSKLEPPAFSKLGIPSFMSFFKSKLPVVHPRGSSGSSLRSSTEYTSLPNIKAMLAPKMTVQTPIKLDLNKNSATMESSNLLPPTLNTENEQTLRKSISLSSLMSTHNIKEPQESISSVPSHKKHATSATLPQWLNSSADNDADGDAQEANMTPMETSNGCENSSENSSEIGISSASYQSVKSPDRPQSTVHATANNRVTDLPLLRKVQLKMAFGKSMGNKALSPEKPEQRSPGNTKQLSLSPKSPKQFDCPGYFDGAVYDLPLKDNEGNKTPISSEKTSPKTPEMVHLLDDEHRQMMAELQKSPDEFFQFQSNVMPTSGSEEANMMVSSPDRFCGSPETSSAGYPEIKSPHAFSFPPSTDGPSGSDASFSFNFQPPQSQKSPQNFSFDFQPSSSQSPPQSEGFGFNSSTSAGSDGFSFNFPGAESASKSPEFSFGFGGNTSASEQKSPPPFFNYDDSDNTGESDTSFSAIFGCGK